MDIYRLKTSYYTVIGPMVCGLLLAGGDKKKIEDITSFGEKIGIAFQIQDDILGIYSDEMGKVKGSDIKEYKQTILFAHAMNTEYKDELLKYYGKNDLDEAINEIDNNDWIEENKKVLLNGFIEYLRGRNK